MNRKTLTIILTIFLIILIALTIVKANISAKPKSKNTNETTRDFMLNSNTLDNINSNGENSVIYIGVTTNGNEDYTLTSAKINKTSSEEEQAKNIISSISEMIAYKIDVNSITIDGNKIKVDFAKTSAPFDLTNSQISPIANFSIIGDYSIRKTIFDSINKSFKSYFGAETEVYFSADSENINIESEGSPALTIDQNQAYLPN